MEKELQLEIPLLLPQVEDEKDQCVERLLERVWSQRGIVQAHVERKNGEACFCLHYDPNLVSLNQVRRLAERAGAEVTERYKHETFRITDMDCGDCAASIEHILGRVDGILTVAVNYAAEKMRVEYDSAKITREKIVQRVQALNYQIQKPEKPENWLQRNWELVLSLLSGVFLATAYFGETFFALPKTAALALYVLAYLAGGFDATRHALKAALHLKFDIDFLMVVAALGAAVLGEWAEGALLLFLFSFGHALEHAAMDKARRAIKALADISPKTARVRRDGREEEMPVENLQRGDLVIVRPGERIPIDGKIREGNSQLDQSPITGESVPVEKSAGDDVFAGSINGEGALEIEVTKLAQDSTLARVIKMVEEAQTQKSPTQRLTQKITQIFVPATLIAVVMVIFLPPLAGWLSWSEALRRAMTMLVAASPCALAIATPSAILAGIAQAARNGVLIKGGVHLENLGELSAIAFDKTGTITHGRPEVADIISLDGLPENDLIQIAASVESRSQHPLAKAVVRLAEQRKISLLETGEVQSITGQGVRSTIGGDVISIGNLKLFGDSDSLPSNIVTQVQTLQSAGKTTMLVQHNRKFIGILGLADAPRAEAKAALARLKQIGIRQTIMLSGDNERVAARIANAVGLSDFRAGLLPEDKVTAIKNLLAQYGKVAMVGDGVNDAPALANASVGIAMGGAGTDVALETADVALMSDALDKLPFAVGLSRHARRIIKQNLFISLGVIALLLPSALLGVTGIGIAIIFHEGSTLVVVANALRLLAYEVK
ncbi:cadmium-translocating P-type ATPase [candidate division KSB1 bacterium]|nr:MAG: cadmium-translocating P-type ATPase [candidate division KSB1 bacterium]MCE7945753.1 cadmium-translocating P-type ATPase [Chlorobi bacterium CHB1]